MSTYQTEAEQIKRRRAIADSLRASGNEALPASIHTGGRFDAPVSGWQYANKAVQQLLGGYMSGRADKSQKKLDEQDKQVLSELIAAKRDSVAPDVNGELDPNIQSDAGPTPVPAASKPLSKAERMQKLQAAMLRGTEFGGSSSGMAGELTERELLPPVQQPYTLQADDVRYDGKNNPVATGLPRTVRESPDDRALINIVDPKSQKGYRTILRSSFKEGTDQLYEKPVAATVGATVAAALTGDGLDLAAERYRQTGTLPPGLGRSPQVTLKVIQRAAEIASANGDDAKAASLRMQFNKAGQSALAQITKQQTMVGAFEKTAKANGSLALQLSKAVDRTGVPLFNSWVNAGRKKLTGNTDLAKFSAAHDTFVSEYSKIMSGSMGNTAVSDAARAHAQQLLDTAMNADTYEGVMGVLNQEMDNRIKGFPSQIADLSAQLSGTGSLPGQESAAPEGPKQYKAGDIDEGYRFKGGDPKNQANWEPVK